jgi:hypothetical protein
MISERTDTAVGECMGLPHGENPQAVPRGPHYRAAWVICEVVIGIVLSVVR